MSSTRMRGGLLLAVLAAGLLVTAVALASAKPGAYAGSTSEHGTVSFTVPKGGRSVNGFVTTDGYNGKCKFKGGVGGLGNFPVRIASMKVGPGGSFKGTVKSKLGPFSATLMVSGKLVGSSARGTVDKPGATCGTSASNPTTHDYLETFTAKVR